MSVSVEEVATVLNQYDPFMIRQTPMQPAGLYAEIAEDLVNIYRMGLLPPSQSYIAAWLEWRRDYLTIRVGVAP